MYDTLRLVYSVILQGLKSLVYLTFLFLQTVFLEVHCVGCSACVVSGACYFGCLVPMQTVQDLGLHCWQ